MKIVLVCSAGMSTSLLVNKMEEAATEKDLDCEIYAVAMNKTAKELEQADVLLFGPQVKYLKGKFEDKAKELNTPIDVIDPMMYGRVDGEAVLEKALSMIE